MARAYASVASAALPSTAAEKQHHADVNAVSTCGRTGLHLAAYYGYAEIVRWLLANGANAAALDADGKTPAAVAQETGHSEVASLLQGAPLGAAGAGVPTSSPSPSASGGAPPPMVRALLPP